MVEVLPFDARGRVRFCPPIGQSRWRPVDRWSDDEWAWWLQQRGWDEAATLQYLNHDRYEYGFGVLPDGTLADATTAHEVGVRWLYNPTPKGVTLHAERKPNILWGGAAGGTKSYGARWEALRCCFKYEDFRVIILRRELEELRRTHLDKLERETMRFKAVFGEKAVNLRTVPPVFSVEKTGAKIIFGHAAHAGDEDKYLSEDYDLFIGDEATQLKPKQIIGVAGRVRNDPKSNRPIGRMILTTNPGGPGHPYCVANFIKKTTRLEENPLYDPSDYVFISAMLYDNPYYMDPDGTYTTYEKRLWAYESESPERRKQLLSGDWSAVVGQFFAEFRPQRHCHKLVVPPEWPRIGSLRWGYGRPGVMLWSIVLPNGHLYIEREHTFKGTLAKDVADEIKAINREAGMHFQIIVGNEEMWGDEEGENIAFTFQANGLYPQREKGDRLNGWQRLRAWLAPLDDHLPGMLINPEGCPRLVETMPHFVKDPKDPEDIDDEVAESASAHALRQLVMSRPAPLSQKAPVVYPPDSAGALLRQLIRSNSSNVLGRYNVR
jgi:hypothetical protein